MRILSSGFLGGGAVAVVQFLRLAGEPMKTRWAHLGVGVISIAAGVALRKA